MKPDIVWTPFFVLVYREIQRFRKVIVQTVITPMINSSLYLLIFGVSLGGHIEIKGGISYLAFLIPGLVMMSCLNNAFQNSSSSIVNAKFTGELEDLRVAPISYNQLIWAYSLGGLVRGFVVGTVTFVIGELFYYFMNHNFLYIEHPLWLLLFMTMGGLAFAQMGMAVAFWARTFDQLSAIGSFVLLPLLYLGGVFFSIEGLHPFWQKLASFNPLLYMINGVRYGVLGVSDVGVGQSFIVSLVFLLVMFVTAWVSLKTASFQRW